MKDMGEGKCPFGFGARAGQAETDEAPARPATGQHMGMARSLSRDRLPELLRAPVAEGQDGLPTGRCLCGKVSFQLKRPAEMVFANHDSTSRKRSGGVSLTLMVRATNTAFSGWGNLVHYPLSARETSCFCRACGTPLLTYFTDPAPMNGMAQISAGALDSTEGLRLAADISDDEKPGYYAFEGERRKISGEELAAMVSGPR